MRLADAARRVKDRKAQQSANEATVREWLTREQAKVGLAQLARDQGVDKANLLKVIKGARKPSKETTVKVLRGSRG